MRNLPLFNTEYGVGSLILREIPSRGEAYIRIQASEYPEKFLQECRNFCKAAGADRIYATGHACCESYPVHTALLQMRGGTRWEPDTEAALIPVQSETASHWRNLCNEKMKGVDHAAFLSEADVQTMIKNGEPYYIHIGDTLLGIGAVRGRELRLVASLVPGGGKEIVKALCHALPEGDAILEVASTNYKAIALYESLGFLKTAALETWYALP